MLPVKLNIHGRGAADNPPNRFVPIAFEPDGDFLDAEEQPAPATVYFKDTSRSVITNNDSPDVGFTYSVNVYCGCSHGWMWSSIIPQLSHGDTGFRCVESKPVRSVWVIIFDAPVETVERHLDIRYAREAGCNWLCEAAGHDTVLYIRTGCESDFDFDDAVKGILPLREGSHVIRADVSGRHPGDSEVRTFVESLLTTFEGVAFDDYGGPWTLSEIRSGELKMGHPFFDYQGWYEQYRTGH